MSSSARQPRDSTNYREGYTYNPATGTYYLDKRPSHPPPPPIPPKELEAGFITKETQHGFAELEGESDAGRLSFDDKSSSSARAERPRRKDKSRDREREKPGRITPRTKRKLRILSLDGGGIRGYSILVILGELMHQIYVQTHNGKGPKSPSELPRPCDYFDIIGGTGTGGLIGLMLGRMRMDVESCKEYYVELTRYVFITDKTVMGVPYGKTLFKASRLEDAIKHCVRESTRFDFDRIVPHSPPPKSPPAGQVVHKRSNSWRGLGSPVRRRTSSLDREQPRGRRGSPSNPSRRERGMGNADAPLLDTRPGACKTFVTAVYKGTPPNSSNPPALLRTYPSRGESVPSYNCTIWQAGRATSATLSAFKPITVGQNTFLDEGSGRYNPAQQVLEEAHLHEYPDDDISVFVSIGTGKRPDTPATPSRSHGHSSHSHAHSTGERSLWWEGIISTPFEDFTEARRRLMAKLDDCERVHRSLIDPEDGGRPGLAKMGVAREDYYRFNVEVGVGDFAMNEWNRLADVSTNTRRYLGQRETGKLVRECAGKMVAIEKANNPDPIALRMNNSSSSSFAPPSPPHEIDSLAELSAEIQRAEAEWSPTDIHPSQRPFSPIEEIVQYPPEPQHSPQFYPVPVLPPVPVKPPKAGKPLYPEPGLPISGAGAPNPEIRVTSPTTVAGDSDDERIKIGSGRRRRSRSNSHGGSSGRRR